jgi:hypothetical protein
MSRLAAFLQVSGLSVLSVGLGLVAVPAGVVAFGVGLAVLGALEEARS